MRPIDSVAVEFVRFFLAVATAAAVMAVCGGWPSSDDQDGVARLEFTQTEIRLLDHKGNMCGRFVLGLNGDAVLDLWSPMGGSTRVGSASNLIGLTATTDYANLSVGLEQQVSTSGSSAFATGSPGLLMPVVRGAIDEIRWDLSTLRALEGVPAHCRLLMTKRSETESARNSVKLQVGNMGEPVMNIVKEGERLVFPERK